MLDEIRLIIEDAVEDAVTGSIEDAFDQLDFSEQISEAVKNALIEMCFVLPDGTVAEPKERLKILCPDKKRLLVCYGGLKVYKAGWNGRPEAWVLSVQLGPSTWDIIGEYETEEKAKAELLKVKNAMEDGTKILEL